MKTNLMNLKTIIRLLSFLTPCILLLSSCSDSIEEVASLITNDDAVEVLESALMEGSEGLSSEVEAAALVAVDYSEESNSHNNCEESFDSTVVVQTNRNNLTASYSTTLGWTLNCNELMVPSVLLFGRSAEGNYDTNRFGGSSQSSSEWTIDNLILGTNWIFNGTFDRAGTHQSKVRNQNGLSFTLNITCTDLEAEKNNIEITSGTGTFTLLLTDSNDNSITFEGSIVFQGNKMATVIINGVSYEIDLN